MTTTPFPTSKPTTAAKGIIFIHYLFGVIALITGLMAFFSGLNVVPDVQHIESASDNEFRFFSVYWLAYGCFCIWVTKDLNARHGFVPALALTMFIAGIARALSTVLVGFPNTIYVGGTVVELVVPIIWFILYKQYTKSLPNT